MQNTDHILVVASPSKKSKRVYVDCDVQCELPLSPVPSTDQLQIHSCTLSKNEFFTQYDFCLVDPKHHVPGHALLAHSASTTGQRGSPAAASVPLSIVLDSGTLDIGSSEDTLRTVWVSPFPQCESFVTALWSSPPPALYVMRHKTYLDTSSRSLSSPLLTWMTFSGTPLIAPKRKKFKIPI
ncbi:hypothetical protein J6590_050514 [Homalodisca vitripennis]|nr:hypothetical protein J6590_050514 [Homalodisca vitripennis]